MTLKAFTMPKWGIEMAEGTVAEIPVAEGADIAKGDILAVVETDKIANEIEADYDARLYRLLMRQGEIYPVGALLGVLGDADHTDAEVDAFIADFAAVDSSFEPGGDSPAATPSQGVEEEAVPESLSESVPESVPEVAEPAAVRTPIDPAIKMTAQARELAESQSVNVSGLVPSTRGGNLTLQDVEKARRGDRDLSGRTAVTPTIISDPMASARAMPSAKKLAEKLGIDLSTIEGTGRKGRIMRGDITAAYQASGDSAEKIMHTGMRRVVAKRLVESKQDIPHYYLNTEIDMGRVLHLRDMMKAAASKGDVTPEIVPSVNDFVIKAAATALVQVPDVNVQVFDDHVMRYGAAHISMAVAVDGGLFTPVIRSADRLSIQQIASETRMLAQKARDGSLLPEDYKGGTFSVSNLGMFGITNFTAVINPPEGAILAVGSIQRLPREVNYALAFVPTMEVTLSCDHRAIDGALGAKFLQAFKQALEHPAALVDGI